MESSNGGSRWPWIWAHIGLTFCREGSVRPGSNPIHMDPSGSRCKLANIGTLSCFLAHRQRHIKEPSRQDKPSALTGILGAALTVESHFTHGPQMDSPIRLKGVSGLQEHQDKTAGVQPGGRSHLTTLPRHCAGQYSAPGTTRRFHWHRVYYKLLLCCNIFSPGSQREPQQGRALLTHAFPAAHLGAL